MIELLIGSSISAFATGIGALPVLLFKNMTHKWRDIILAFTAGIMVAASTFSLIPESMNSGHFIPVAVGLLLGTFVLNVLEKNIPHIDLDHSKRKIAIDNKSLLIISALTLHNIPEGLSVGLSYASSEPELGVLISIAIGLQNAPEGLLIALFLVMQNVKKWKALLIATATGAIEILAAVIGYLISSSVENIIPYGLSFAAGAMLFIVYKELIPESHGDGHERSSTYAFIIGLIAMLYLTVIF